MGLDTKCKLFVTVIDIVCKVCFSKGYCELTTHTNTEKERCLHYIRFLLGLEPVVRLIFFICVLSIRL